MSGTRGAYEPLRQTQREVEGGREEGSPRNYEALRQTQQEVDARPSQTPQQQAPTPLNPYENVDERLEAHSKSLQPEVDAGRITTGDQNRAVNIYSNELRAKQIQYDKEKQAEALDRVAAIRAQNGPDRQPEHQNEMER